MSLRIPRHKLLHLLDGGKTQLATEVGLLDAEGVPDEPWVPLQRLDIPDHIIEVHHTFGLNAPDAMFKNDIYEVMVFTITDKDGESPPATHLSIKRYDRAAIRNWRHFQQMKNEIVGPEFEAMEIYPRESRLADNANQYHLFVLPEGMDIPFGFSGAMVLTDPDEVAQYNEGKGRQEPLQEGLTVGDTANAARNPEVDEKVRLALDKFGGER